MTNREAPTGHNPPETIPIPSRVEMVRGLVNDFALIAAGKSFPELPQDYFKPHMIPNGWFRKKMWKPVQEYFRKEVGPQEIEQFEGQMEWQRAYNGDGFTWDISYTRYLDSQKGLSEKEKRSAQIIGLRRIDGDGVGHVVLIEQIQDPSGDLSIKGSWHAKSNVIYREISSTTPDGKGIANTPEALEQVRGVMAQFKSEIPQKPVITS